MLLERPICGTQNKAGLLTAQGSLSRNGLGFGGARSKGSKFHTDGAGVVAEPSGNNYLNKVESRSKPSAG